MIQRHRFANPERRSGTAAFVSATARATNGTMPKAFPACVAAGEAGGAFRVGGPSGGRCGRLWRMGGARWAAGQTESCPPASAASARTTSRGTRWSVRRMGGLRKGRQRSQRSW